MPVSDEFLSASPPARVATPSVGMLKQHAMCCYCNNVWLRGWILGAVLNSTSPRLSVSEISASLVNMFE